MIFVELSILTDGKLLPDSTFLLNTKISLKQVYIVAIISRNIAKTIFICRKIQPISKL